MPLRVFLNVLFYFLYKMFALLANSSETSLSLVLFLLDSLSVSSRHQIPRIHEPIHTHGDAFLLGTIQFLSWLTDALFEALFSHFREQFLCICQGDLLLDGCHQLILLSG